MQVDSRIARRLAIVGVCVLSLVVCCGLAWWQWDRYSSAGGSFQNLGYVLQWPLFGLFPAFVFWRIRKLSMRPGESADAQAGGGAYAAPDRNRQAYRPVPAQGVARGPVAPTDEDDDELAAYNRYLAELHARDQQQR